MRFCYDIIWKIEKREALKVLCKNDGLFLARKMILNILHPYTSKKEVELSMRTKKKG